MFVSIGWLWIGDLPILNQKFAELVAQLIWWYYVMYIFVIAVNLNKFGNFGKLFGQPLFSRARRPSH